jgi:hypothetical protein
MSKRLDLFGNDKGLGDTVHRAIDKFTGGMFGGCGGCKKRKQALNQWMPYNNEPLNNALDALEQYSKGTHGKENR